MGCLNSFFWTSGSNQKPAVINEASPGDASAICLKSASGRPRWPLAGQHCGDVVGRTVGLTHCGSRHHLVGGEEAANEIRWELKAVTQSFPPKSARTLG